jgi:hypothetical protein
MRTLTIILLLVVSVFQSKAQGNEYIISLVPDSVCESLRFSCSDVLDARNNKKNIGFVQIGLINKIVLAQLNGGFTNHLKQTIDKLVPDNKTQLTLIFRFFIIAENTNPEIEESYCKIEIEFAKKVDGKLFSLGIFDSHIIGGGFDVTKKHPKRILKGIQECFRKFDKTNWESKEGILIADINHGYNYNHKIVPPKGVYLSYGQLTRKQPTENVNYKIIERYDLQKNYDTYVINFDNIDDNYVQYVSNDTNIFLRINNNNIYIKSKHHGKYIYFR